MSSRKRNRDTFESNSNSNDSSYLEESKAALPLSKRLCLGLSCDTWKTFLYSLYEIEVELPYCNRLVRCFTTSGVSGESFSSFSKLYQHLSFKERMQPDLLHQITEQFCSRFFIRPVSFGLKNVRNSESVQKSFFVLFDLTHRLYQTDVSYQNWSETDQKLYSVFAPWLVKRWDYSGDQKFLLHLLSNLKSALFSTSLLTKSETQYLFHSLGVTPRIFTSVESFLRPLVQHRKTHREQSLPLHLCVQVPPVVQEESIYSLTGRSIEYWTIISTLQYSVVWAQQQRESQQTGVFPSFLSLFRTSFPSCFYTVLQLLVLDYLAIPLPHT
jgi:hypothetical protein